MPARRAAAVLGGSLAKATSLLHRVFCGGNVQPMHERVHLCATEHLQFAHHSGKGQPTHWGKGGGGSVGAHRATAARMFLGPVWSELEMRVPSTRLLKCRQPGRMAHEVLLLLRLGLKRVAGSCLARGHPSHGGA